MNKNEYMTTINENLSAAEGLCGELRKLRNFKKISSTLPAIEGLLNAELLDRAITDRETQLQKVRSELGKARRVVKKLEEIEAIEAGTAEPKAKKSTPKKVAVKPATKTTTEKTAKKSTAEDAA